MRRLIQRNFCSVSARSPLVKILLRRHLTEVAVLVIVTDIPEKLKLVVYTTYNKKSIC